MSSSLLWERWDEIDRLLSAALEHPGPEREAWIRREVVEDGPFQELVLRLATRLETDQDRVSRPSESLVSRAFGPEEARSADSELSPGTRIGRYEIVARRGRGGMATVYEAERVDGVYRQRVALKVLRRGLDTDDLIHRFLTERQILSSLSHPNIARLLDGGSTPDGRPYLVMELVDGQPITHHADQRQLDVQARLRLFLGVADAVHAAHRRLVVHRDIKPSNILVDGEGRVKLLDFGIAKLLDESGEQTQVGARALTPDYASPEQLRGDSVTTATDVYQLGLLLRELLTGVRPLRTETVPGEPPIRASRLAERGLAHSDSPEARATARGTSPPRLARELRGDLDLILDKALRPEPEERYPSAEALVEDVRCHLSGLPVRARPDTAGYRVRKFIGRHRWVAPTAALVTLLAAGWVATLQRQRDIAREEAQRAREVQRLFVDLVSSPDPFAPQGGPGRDVTVREALTMGADRLRGELREMPALRAELLGTVSQVLQNLGALDEAVALTEEALATERERYGERSMEVAASMGRLGNLLIDRRRGDSAETVIHGQVRLISELADPRDPRLGEALFNLGRAYSSVQKFDLATAEFERAADILRSADPPRGEELVKVLQALSQGYVTGPGAGRDPDFGLAIRTAEEAVQVAERLWGAEHPGTARARLFLGQVLRWGGNFAEAERELRRSVPILEERLGPSHPFTLSAQNILAEFLATQGGWVEAAELYGRILEGTITLHGEGSMPVARARVDWARSLARIARAAEAESLYVEAVATYRALGEQGTRSLWYSLAQLAELYLDQGRFKEAEAAAAESLEIGRVFWGADIQLAFAECRLGLALAGQGRTREALELLPRAAAAMRARSQAPSRLKDQCVQALEEFR